MLRVCRGHRLSQLVAKDGWHCRRQMCRTKLRYMHGGCFGMVWQWVRSWLIGRSRGGFFASRAGGRNVAPILALSTCEVRQAIGAPLSAPPHMLPPQHVRNWFLDWLVKANEQEKAIMLQSLWQAMRPGEVSGCGA